MEVFLSFSLFLFMCDIHDLMVNNTKITIKKIAQWGNLENYPSISHC